MFEEIRDAGIDTDFDMKVTEIENKLNHIRNIMSDIQQHMWKMEELLEMSYKEMFGFTFDRD